MTYLRTVPSGLDHEAFQPPHYGTLAPLRRILKAYNAVRTHLSLNKDAPIHRPIHRIGRIIPVPILGGLHHQYCRT